jgi:hypothetical protein
MQPLSDLTDGRGAEESGDVSPHSKEAIPAGGCFVGLIRMGHNDLARRLIRSGFGQTQQRYCKRC